MRIATAILIASGLVAVTGVASAQSAMPDFSNPYGGVSAYLHDDANVAAATAPKPLKKSAARKPSGKIARRAAAPQDANAQKPIDLDADGGFAPADTAPHPDSLSPASQSKQKDSNIGFDMKWSASSDPIYNPEASTIPGVDQVKRSVNQDPVETGSGVQAGVNLKF